MTLSETIAKHYHQVAPTAPHVCEVLGCPGPVNKRKLEAVDEMLAALKVLVLTPHIRYCLEAIDPMALKQARAAIAKAQDQQP